jgi:hypothetical protein
MGIREEFEAWAHAHEVYEDDGEKLPMGRLSGCYYEHVQTQAAWEAWQASRASPSKYDEVLNPFLEIMKRELAANSYKGDRPGWLKMTPGDCLLEIYYHTGKLHKAVHGSDAASINEYAADVANMSMMIVDICGGLALSTEEVKS